MSNQEKFKRLLKYVFSFNLDAPPSQLRKVFDIGKVRDVEIF